MEGKDAKDIMRELDKLRDANGTAQSGTDEYQRREADALVARRSSLLSGARRLRRALAGIGVAAMNSPEASTIEPAPEPEGSDPKEVFAFYGRCAYFSQVFEQGLVNLSVALHARGLTKVTRHDFESAWENAGRKTLGQLLTDIRKKLDVSADMEKGLDRRAP